MRSPQAAWAESGAMWLTGHTGGPPLVAPAGIVTAIGRLGDALDVDALALLGERAAITGLSRRGATSAGGGTRLLRTADRVVVAVSMTRPDDVALLPAWLDIDVPSAGTPGDDLWEELAGALCRRSADVAVARAAGLGLAVSRLGEVTATSPVVTTSLGAARRLHRAPVVVDLSSLWAGPLAGRLLLQAGARVIKVESLARPDGARNGDARFFDLMHAGKESVALDFGSAQDVAHLRGLLAAADVVVEASRPRALEQLGIDARELTRSGPRVWLSITGYGRDECNRHRVAFGDDAAVAGGLVADGDSAPCFVADAVADPLTGVVAAAAVLDALRAGERMLLDLALARVAAYVASSGAGERWRESDDVDARPPMAPEPTSRAAPLGEHTDAVVRELIG